MVIAQDRDRDLFSKLCRDRGCATAAREIWEEINKAPRPKKMLKKKSANILMQAGLNRTSATFKMIFYQVPSL
jgi:hypothetical protein